MPKRNKHGRPNGISERADGLVNLSTSDKYGDIEPPTKSQISMLMAHLGRKGGKIGGKRRLQTMTKKERADIARKAAHARWQAK